MGNKTRARAVMQGTPVDLNRLAQIESSYVADATNPSSGARGLNQITPVALADWNQHNPNDAHTLDQLYQPEVNSKVAQWYVNQRIPQMIGAFGLPDTTDNRLIAYNYGIGNLRKHLLSGQALPKETADYLNKYKNIKVTGQPTQGAAQWQ